MTWRAGAIALAVGLAACVRGAADHEALGDETYVRGAYRDAIAEYRLALETRPGDPDVLVKLGAAALHSSALSEAADAYRALADVPERRQEALVGLWRAVGAASEAGERAPMLAALRSIREIDPDLRLGRYAVRAALDEIAAGTPREALALLPSAAAAADGRMADSLLFVYAELMASAGRCRDAARVFEGLLRRGRAPEIVDEARNGLTRCALREGQAALRRGEPLVAEGYFRRAASPLAPASVARRAWLGLGDVRRALGDLIGAAEAYERARGGLPADADSIARIAAQRLDEIGTAEERIP